MIKFINNIMTERQRRRQAKFNAMLQTAVSGGIKIYGDMLVSGNITFAIGKENLDNYNSEKSQSKVVIGNI